MSQGLYILRKEHSTFGRSHRPVSETERALQGFIHTATAGLEEDGSSEAARATLFLLNVSQVLCLSLRWPKDN